MGPPITRETAREYGRRGIESQRRERARCAEQAALLSRALSIVRVETDKLTDYRSIRLARVRNQLDAIDSLIDSQLAASKPDSDEIVRLCSAGDKLAEQERLLAGRPAPKAEESRRDKVRQGARNSDVAASDRADGSSA